MKKLTIAEIEAIVNRPELGDIEILPDGCVISTVGKIRTKVRRTIHPMRHIKISVPQYLRWIRSHLPTPSSDGGDK